MLKWIYDKFYEIPFLLDNELQIKKNATLILNIFSFDIKIIISTRNYYFLKINIDLFIILFEKTLSTNFKVTLKSFMIDTQFLLKF